MILLLKYIREELKFISKQTGLILLLFTGIPFLTLWFAGAYYTDYVYDVPIAVLDEDNSELSRTITEHFDSNERFQVKYHVSNKNELQEYLDTQKVYMGLYIPQDLNNKILSGETTPVLILTNGTNIVIGNNVYASAATIVQTISAGAGIKIISSKGSLPQSTATSIELPFQFTDRMLYDPQLTYMNYLIYGFVAIFFQQLMLSGLATLILRNPEETAQNHTIHRLTAKIIAAAGSLMLVSAGSMLFIHKKFHVIFTGNVWLAFFLSVLFAIAISCPAILLCAITKNKTKFSQISYMLSLPTFLTCGYVWPTDQMPYLLSLVIKLIWPLIYFARTFDEIIVKNLPWEAVKPNALCLIVYSIVFIPMSILIFKKRFTKSEKETISKTETNSLQRTDFNG